MPGFESELLGIILSSSIVIKAVLVALLLFSLLSWAIIFFKLSAFLKVRNENKAFLGLYWKVENLGQLRRLASRYTLSPLVRIFQTGFERLDAAAFLDKEGNLREPSAGVRPLSFKSLERELKRTGEEQIGGLEHYLSFLATTGNVSPFIGLFGTVLGIIGAFHEIGRQGSASIAAVAPGVSEALVATAAGLLVAIPAVVAFNYFMSRVRIMASEMESFSTDFLSMTEDRLSQTRASGWDR
jgi:biopolymer transport protein TolQ